MNQEVEQKTVQERSFFALKQSILKHPWKLLKFFCVVQTTVWLITTGAVIYNGNFLEEPKTNEIIGLCTASCLLFVFLSFFNFVPYKLLADLMETTHDDDPLCKQRNAAILFMVMTIFDEIIGYALIFICVKESLLENIKDSIVPAFLLNLLWMPLFLVLTHKMCTCRDCHFNCTETVYTITYNNEQMSFEKGSKLTRMELCSVFSSLPNKHMFVCDVNNIVIIELDSETSSLTPQEDNIFLKTADDF